MEVCTNAPCRARLRGIGRLFIIFLFNFFERRFPVGILFRYYLVFAWTVRFSVNGDLAIGEFLSASVDPSTNILLSGAQDNGCAFSDLSPSTSNGGWNGSTTNLKGNGGVRIGGDGNYINMDLSTGSGPRYFATAQEFQGFIMASPQVCVRVIFFVFICASMLRLLSVLLVVLAKDSVSALFFACV